MPIICWGALGKAASDPTSIDQEIITYIERHDENINAHMGEDYALGIHRLQTVIDHAPYSIFNRFVYPAARNFKSIVDKSGNGDHIDIQSAINYVSALGGGSIFIKNGTYALDSILTLYNNIELVGEDRINTIIDCVSEDRGILMSGRSNARIRNLKIINSTAEAILIHNSNFCRIENVNFYNNGIDIYVVGYSSKNIIDDTYSSGAIVCGLYVDTAIDDAAFNNYSNMQIIDPQENGVVFSKGYQSYFNRIIVKDSIGYGFYIDDNSLDRSLFLACVAFSCNNHGFYIYRADRVSFIGCESVSNLGAGFYIDIVSDCIFNNNHVTDNGARGIHLTANSGKNVVLGNNVIHNTTANITDSGTANEVAHNVLT